MNAIREDFLRKNDSNFCLVEGKSDKYTLSHHKMRTIRVESGRKHLNESHFTIG